MPQEYIEIHGARENNLKNVSLRIPKRKITIFTGVSPLGLAVGGILLAFVPATSVIAFSALACILVGLVGLISPAFRGMSLPPAA